MIYIDLPADLNLEDDQGRNVARLADAVTPGAVTPGAVLVAGAARAWSWAVVENVDSGFVYFRQISAQDAARRGSLVKPLPQSALPRRIRVIVLLHHVSAPAGRGADTAAQQVGDGTWDHADRSGGHLTSGLAGATFRVAFSAVA